MDNYEEKYAKLTYEFVKDLTEEQVIQFDNIIDLIGQQDYEHNTDIPFYIFEEFIRYYQKDKSPVVLDNLKALLWLAKKNNRITQERIDFLLEHYT